MSKSRLKAPATVITTREQMETLVGEIAALKTREQKYTAEMNHRVNAVRADYEDSLAGIADELNGKMAIAKDWAEAHPAEFGKAKSIGMTHGDVGWRIGNPALRTLPGFTWDRVLEKLQGFVHWHRYIRTKQEVNKECILADRATFAAEELKSMGVRVVQDEAFFIDPRIATPEARVQEAA